MNLLEDKKQRNSNILIIDKKSGAKSICKRFYVFLEYKEYREENPRVSDDLCLEKQTEVWGDGVED